MLGSMQLGSVNAQLGAVGYGARSGDQITTANSYFARSIAVDDAAFARAVTGQSAAFARTVTTQNAER